VYSLTFQRKKMGLPVTSCIILLGALSKEKMWKRMISCSNSQTSLFSLATTFKCQCPVGKCLRDLQGICARILATPGLPPGKGGVFQGKDLANECWSIGKIARDKG
jgi:hypothetical protein